MKKKIVKDLSVLLESILLEDQFNPRILEAWIRQSSRMELMEILWHLQNAPKSMAQPYEMVFEHLEVLEASEFSSKKMYEFIDSKKDVIDSLGYHYVSLEERNIVKESKIFGYQVFCKFDALPHEEAVRIFGLTTLADIYYLLKKGLLSKKERYIFYVKDSKDEINYLRLRWGKRYNWDKDERWVLSADYIRSHGGPMDEVVVSHKKLF